MCAEPTKTDAASFSDSLPQADSSALPRIEYSSSEPCALTAKRAPVAAPTGAPSSTWFANTRSAGRCSRSAAAFASTYALSLGLREVLQQPRLETLVAVEDEHGQHRADARPHGRARRARSNRSGCGSWENDRHVVAGARPLAHERLRVDVRSRPAQQVAVPDEDAHERQ